jgi:hypothetical protein
MHMMAAAKSDGPDDGSAQGSGPGERGLRAPVRAQRPDMTYRIRLEDDYLHAELAYCETVAEMHSFLRATVRNALRSSNMLIRVRASKPVFHVERDGLLEYFQEIGRLPRQRGVDVRSFRNEVEALLWFRDRRYLAERRRGVERRDDAERRAETDTERRMSADRRSGGDRRGSRAPTG